MRDLQQALEQISVIRSQIARGTQFRGYGPRSTAASGVLAIALACGQSWWFQGRVIDADAFLVGWITTAVVSAGLSCWEALVRSRRIHFELSREMFQTALEQFLPSLVAGLMLTVIVVRGMPREVWMLPGWWAMAFGLGVFASRQFLPRAIFAVGMWYLVTGLSCLAWGAGSRELSPWMMGIPFGAGQLLMAAVLRYGYEDPGEESYPR